MKLTFIRKITYKFIIISTTSFCPVNDVKCTLKTETWGHLHWSEWSKQDSLLCNFPVIHVVRQSTGICFFAFHNKHCLKDRSRRQLNYSGIRCLECPFLNMTWSSITNMLPWKTEHLKNTTTSGILTCLNIVYLIIEIFRRSMNKTPDQQLFYPR